MDLNKDPHISNFSSHVMQKCGHEHNHLLLCVFQTELGAVCTPQVSHGRVNHSSWTVQLRPSWVCPEACSCLGLCIIWVMHLYDHGYSSDMSGEGNRNTVVNSSYGHELLGARGKITSPSSKVYGIKKVIIALITQ